MTDWCPKCQLPDNYCGQGDGIGSCDCSRCGCCGAGPVDDCECGRDFDELYDDEGEPFDPLCNDTTCVWRAARLDQKAKLERWHLASLGPGLPRHGHVEGACTESCDNRECPRGLTHGVCTEECGRG